MANKKFLSQIDLTNEREEDFRKAGPYDSTSSQFNNALQSTGAFKFTRFSFDAPKADESATAEGESALQQHYNFQTDALKNFEPYSPLLKAQTSGISFFDRSVHESVSGVYQDNLRGSNYEAVLAQ